MEWFRRLHPSERAERALEVILERTGIGAEIQKELADEKASSFEELRKRKTESVARMQKAAAPANAAVAAAEDKEKQTRKLADEALKDYVKAREQLTTIYETHRNECEAIDCEMFQCYPAEIDAFIAELEQMLDMNQRHYRAWPDPKGPYQGLGGVRADDNRIALEARATAIFRLKHDIVPLLKTAHHIESVTAEIERLRKTIPGVP